MYNHSRSNPRIAEAFASINRLIDAEVTPPPSRNLPYHPEECQLDRLLTLEMNLTSHSVSRRTVLFAGFAVPLLAGCQHLPRLSSQKQVRVDAPFDMPSISLPDFAASPRFVITDFGAVPNDQQKTSAAIAHAIAAANAAGSGVVVVPEGEWLTGKVHLKSNVNLHLEKGATLLFSERPGDYLPAVMTTWEGLECYNYSPLVYAFECENVAITGQGTLRAKLDVWRIWYARPKAHMDALVALYHMAAKDVPVSERQMTTGDANLRPQFIQFNRCRNVLVEDISIIDSPFWVLHPYLCRDVVIRRVKIKAHGHNNDGVDPEMSQNVLIEECVFDQGDDAVSVKSGRDRDAWRIGVPSRNIVMRNCRIKNGHQLMAIGSELSGGVENVFVDNCHFDHAGSTARSSINNILYVKTNERRGGFVRNIHLSNVSATQIAGGVLSVETDVLYQWRTLVPTYERRLTPIEGLHVSNVTVGDAKFICYIKAEAEMAVKNVSLRDIKVKTERGTPVFTENVQGFVNEA
ncbi:glycoside hydrolase family 28 protein [Massilia horti]|nr:glycoside hydrolase family 28 protein [Massilia horti]